VIGLNHYLVVSAALFSLGVLGVLTRRNAINEDRHRAAGLRDYAR
jgi:NADH:ubiquinone oxidoreductase subunit K